MMMVQISAPVNEVCVDFCTIGQRLKAERERIGLNQVAFSAIAESAKRTLIDWEKGSSFPTAAQLAALSVVGVDVQYVITGQRSAQTLSVDEQELLSLFRAASLAGKAAAIGALRGVAGATVSKQVSVSAPGGNAAGRDMVVNSTKGSSRREQKS